MMNHAGLVNHDAFVARQKHLITDIQKDIAASEKTISILKSNPSVRPDYDPKLIAGVIEEKKLEATRMETTILASQCLEDGVGLEAENLPATLRMKKELVALQIQLEDLESMLSPIRLLPIEVLVEIFTLSCAYPPMQDSVSLHSAPLLVSHVCSTWRRVALSKTDLWSFIALRITEDLAFSSEGLLSLVKLWLDRSGTQPLRIRLQSEAERIHSHAHTFLRLLDLFTPHCSRWKEVMFDSTRCRQHNAPLFSQLPENASFPLVESFTLRTGQLNRRETARITHILQSAPHLHHISWLIKNSFEVPAHPYSKLTKLELGSVHDLDDVLEILKCSNLLKAVNMCVYIPAGTIAHNVFNLRHEILEEAYFACSGNSSAFLGSLTLPTLTRLTLDQLPDFTSFVPLTWSQETFLAFIRRSKCILSGLSIVAFDMQPDDVLSTLRYLSPSLVQLSIAHMCSPCITDSVLKALTYPSTPSPPLLDEKGSNNPEESASPILCPILRHLKLHGCVSSSDGVLAGMVESRCRPPLNYPGLAELQIGSFRVNAASNVQDKARLRTLRSRHNHMDYICYI